MIRKSFLLQSLVFAFAVGLAGCKGMPIDPSTSAAEAGDYTLITSACEAAPGYGMDICRVTDGTAIQSAWVLIVPAKFAHVVSGEVNVYYRDIVKNYSVTNKVISIPWADFFGSSTWNKSMDGEALALVSITYVDNQGIQVLQTFRGIAKIVVTSPGYARLPIDSGYAAWKTTCKIQYSTAGRSAISCK